MKKKKLRVLPGGLVSRNRLLQRQELTALGHITQ